MPSQILIIFLAIAGIICYWQFLEFINDFENSLRNLKELPSLEEGDFVGKEEKIKYLNQKNQEYSKLLKLSPPSLLIVDDDQDQVTAVNNFFKKAVIWEKRTLDNLNKEALGAILAHELFHIKHYHYLKGITLRGVLYIISLAVIAFFQANLVIEDKNWFSLIVGIFSLIGMFRFSQILIDAIDNSLGRLDEISCDKFSIEVSGKEAFLQEAQYFLKRETEALDLKGQKDFKIVAFFKYYLFHTHPSWESRISLTSKK